MFLLLSFLSGLDLMINRLFILPIIEGRTKDPSANSVSWKMTWCSQVIVCLLYTSDAADE